VQLPDNLSISKERLEWILHRFAFIVQGGHNRIKTDSDWLRDYCKRMRPLEQAQILLTEALPDIHIPLPGIDKLPDGQQGYYKEFYEEGFAKMKQYILEEATSLRMLSQVSVYSDDPVVKKAVLRRIKELQE
jgi:hypothetical protein